MKRGWLIWLLAVSPAAFTAYLVWRYGVDVPIGDQWRFVAPLLEHATTGRFSVAELFEQANESRPAFPRLVFLLSALLTGWNTRVEMAISVVLLISMSLGCWLLLRRWAPRRSWALLGPLFVTNLVLFSPAQYDGLLWGIPLIGYATTACLLAGLVVALEPSLSDAIAWALVIPLCVIATFSYANGFLVWLLLAPTLWIRRCPKDQPLLLWFVWACVLAACVSVYFLGYVKPARHPSWWIALERPREVLLAYLAYLGGAFGFGARRFGVAGVVGAGVLTLFAVTCVWIATVGRRYSDRTSYLPWLLVALYGFGSGVPIVIGRIGLGSELVLRSHYVMFSAWAVVGTLLLVCSCWLHVSDDDRASPRRGLRPRAVWFASVSAAMWVSLAVLHALALPDIMVRVKSAHRDRLIAKSLLRFIDQAPDDEVNPFLDSIATAPYVRARVHGLRRAGMLREADIDWASSPSDDCRMGWVDTLSVQHTRALRVAGWAYLPEADRPGDAVVLTAQKSGARNAVAFVRPRQPREDVAKRLGRPRAASAGWTLSLEWPQPGQIQAWVIDAETMQAYALCVINDRFLPDSRAPTAADARGRPPATPATGLARRP
ncbi:MAG: hypothetical protein GEV06_04120 [Luteitalea sp.]|nr:hypothetical protein [Luteitalea sp.]